MPSPWTRRIPWRSAIWPFARHFEAVFGWGNGPAESHARLGDAARKAVDDDQNDAMTHTALAIFDLFSGRHEEARRRLHRALDLDPNSMFARGYLGVSYGFGGDYETALPHLEEAMRLSPRGPLLVIWRLCRGSAALTAERYQQPAGFATQACERHSVLPGLSTILSA